MDNSAKDHAGSIFLLRMLENQIISPNEARAFLGLEPIQEDDIQYTTLYAGDKAVCRIASGPHRSLVNCPNCSAPVRGLECEYCGTKF